MLTSFLEKLIHKGAAEYRTFVCGVGGVSVLPVSKGSYIIITDLIYNPFTNLPEQTLGENTLQILKLVNKQLEIRSNKSINHYVIRDSAPNAFIPVTINTYLVHESDVTFNFAQIPSITTGDFTLTYGLQQITDDVLEKPLGYGDHSGVVQHADLVAPAEQYQPQTFINSNTTPAADYREQLKVNIVNKTKLTNLNAPEYNDYIKDRAYPILNVGYVIINENPNQYTRSS